MLASDTFSFLNQTRSIRSFEAWDDVDAPRLWRYNLHYFDDLNAVGSGARTEWHENLVARWIRENPPGRGTGWEPYPTSLRIVNWIKWSLAGHSLPEPARPSLAIQARWLRKRLEIHLLGNHLWSNAKALAFAGAYFSGGEAARWRSKGLAVLDVELGEQVLGDGGHFERSPMYHASFLEDVLDLVNLARVYPECLPEDLVRKLKDRATSMLRWLEVMTHPDGRISFFNDAAFNVAPEHAALAAYARRLGIRVDERPLGDIEALQDSGYVRLQTERAVAICDVAAVGPDHLPAHAHADTLAFELSLDARRVLVNGGTSTYDRGPERRRQRSTAAHNTVQVDDEDSSEVWSSFRVARRAKPFAIRSGRGHGEIWLDGAHDGYRRLPGRVIHRRRWALGQDTLVVTDRLEGAFHDAISRLRLHPDLSVGMDEASDASVRVQMDGREALRISVGPDASLRSDQSVWHPEFGVSVDAIVLSSKFAGPTHETRLRW
jgi:uncharacterized heparinase superfamily protein